MYIDWYGVSDIGISKDVNQDTILCDLHGTEHGDMGIFAVADGVGGLERGELASSVAIDTLRVWWDNAVSQSQPEMILSETFASNIHQINVEISKYQYNMATTLSSLLILRDKCFILHIGDSRIYHYRTGLISTFKQITVDHALTVTSCDRNGEVFQRGMLTDCLGKISKEGYYSAALTAKPNDIFFLCSDGICKTQSDKAIRNAVARNRRNTAEICRSLVNGAKKNGETDNVSAIAVRILKKPLKK